jgi:hypothetical protein
MKKIFAAILSLTTSLAFGTTLSPITLLNPAGSSSGQAIVSTGASSAPAWGGIGVSGIAAIGANTVLANATGSSASPTAFSMPGCSGATSALGWASGSGFACNSSINAATLGGATFASPGTIGGTTPGAATFTNLTGTGTISLPSASLSTTVLSGLGTGVQTGLQTSVNIVGGFVGYSFSILTGAGISPYSYGAVGNGSTDDTTALQNWINGSGASGEPGFCSNGAYKITKTLLISALQTKIMGPGGTACAITPAFGTAPTISGAAAGATYAGSATSIRLTVSSTAAINGAIEVTGVAGTTEANGAWPAVVIDSTHVDIVGPTFVHAYTSGGTVNYPAIAVVPSSTPNTAAQPTLDLSGVYFAPPSQNAGNTDVAIITGGAFNSPGSAVIIHDMVENGYRGGFFFWQSYAPVFRNVFFYNNQSAAIIANQDTSFSNGLLDHAEFFSNGGTYSQPAVNLGGANYVENPVIFASQFSGNYGGLLLNNVQGATVQGNYIENNTSYNLNCGSAANSVGANITGNWLSYNSGTNSTYLQYCTAATFNNNWLFNQTITLGADSVVLAGSNNLTGTAALNYAAATPSSLVSSTVSTQAITSATPTNVTSVSLAQGNWECTGGTLTHPAGSTTQSSNLIGLSRTSATFPGTVSQEVLANSTSSAGLFVGQMVGPVYYTLTTATTLYLVAQANYAVSTLTIDGDIHCHRIF